MLDEGVQLMKQAWTDGKATLAGTHYEVDGAIVRPLPLQPGGIPLWIAGGGEKKTLRTAAAYADYTNFDGTPETFKHKSEVLAQHCRDLGRDFAEITRTADYNVVIGETEADVKDRLDWIMDHYAKHVTQDHVERYRHMFETGPLVGTPERIVERLRGLEKLGMTYAITYWTDAAYDRSSIELFETQVIPELR
jgi:alkanesulfonate monooxygenase SsuD/methylene tetrahydromethanopterin reductase-like flavin-dependent oxidoreductase (luciferase family)